MPLSIEDCYVGQILGYSSPYFAHQRHRVLEIVQPDKLVVQDLTPGSSGGTWPRCGIECFRLLSSCVEVEEEEL